MAGAPPRGWVPRPQDRRRRILLDGAQCPKPPLGCVGLLHHPAHLSPRRQERDHKGSALGVAWVCRPGGSPWLPAAQVIEIYCDLAKNMAAAPNFPFFWLLSGPKGALR